MKVALRNIEVGDSTRIHAWRTSREVAQWMVNDGPIPWEDHERWFEGALIDGPTRVRIVSCGGVDCGLLSWTDESDAIFSFGIYVVPSLSPARRVGTAALFLLLRQLFEEANAQEVRAEVLVDNSRAVKVYEALGFSRVIGSERQVSRLNGMSEVVEMKSNSKVWRANASAVEEQLIERGLVDDSQ